MALAPPDPLIARRAEGIALRRLRAARAVVINGPRQSGKTALLGILQRRCVELLQPQWIIGVGDFAANRAEQLFGSNEVKIGKILHPSPACPASNVDWGGTATKQLQILGVWQD